jgi:hypothetical protein
VGKAESRASVEGCGTYKLTEKSKKVRERGLISGTLMSKEVVALGTFISKKEKGRGRREAKATATH